MSFDQSTPPEVLAAAAAMKKDGAPELTAERLQDLATIETEVHADFGPVLAQINSDLGLALASRPDGYHVTIVGPTEKDTIKNLAPEQLRELQRISDTIQSEVTVKGIGIIGKNRVPNLRKADQDKVTCFVAFDIPALNAFRTSVGLPPKDFHVTLGFVGGDIHFQVTGEREDGKKRGKMVEITAPIAKKADPALAKYELPTMTFGALSGKEKQKAQEKPAPERLPVEKKPTLISPQMFGEVSKFLKGLDLANSNEIFGILKAAEPNQDLRVLLEGKVDAAVVDQIAAKVEELNRR